MWPPAANWVTKWHNLHCNALVQNLVIRWRHFHCFQCWPPGHVTCIATLSWIALFALSVSIGLVSSSARVTSVKSQKGGSRTDRQTPGPKDRTQDTWVRLKSIQPQPVLKITGEGFPELILAPLASRYIIWK